MGRTKTDITRGCPLFLPRIVCNLIDFAILNRKIIRPGFLVNIFIGGIAALVSWGLYGPFAEAFIIGGTAEPDVGSIGLSLSSVIGGLLVGVGGARWLTNEVDKKLLRAAASKAASGQPSDQKAIRISAAPPAEALSIAAE